MVMAHRRSQLSHEVEVGDDIQANGFWGNNATEPESDRPLRLPRVAPAVPSRPVAPAVPSRRPCRRVTPAVPSRPVAPAVPSRHPLLSRPVSSSLLSRPVPSSLLSRRVAPLLSCRVAPSVPSHPVRVALPVLSHRTRPVRPARPSRPVRPARPRLSRPSLPVAPVLLCRTMCHALRRPFRRLGFRQQLYASAMGTPRVLRYDAEGRPLEFLVWLLRARRLLESQVQAHETLWAHASGDLPEPADPAPLAGDPIPADSDRYARKRADVTAWKLRDAAACIALCSLLLESEETHFTQVCMASEFLTAIKARYATPTTISLGHQFLPFLFPDLASFERTGEFITHLCSLNSSYRTASTDAQLALLPPPMAITIYFIATSLPDRLASVRDALLLKHPSELTIEVLESALKDVESNLCSVASASGVVPPPLFHGCTVPQLPTFTASLATAATDVTAAAVMTSSRSRGRSGRRGGQGPGRGGGGGGGDVASGGGGSSSATHWFASRSGGAAVWYLTQQQQQQQQPLPSQQPQQQQRQQQVSGGGAGVRTASAAARCRPPSLHLSRYDRWPPQPALWPQPPTGSCSGGSFVVFHSGLRSFALFLPRLYDTYPASYAATVALANPTSGPVTARYTTKLPCPAVPSGSLTGFHVPSFSRNLLGVRPLVSQHVGVWIEPSGETAACVDGDTAVAAAAATIAAATAPNPCHCPPSGSRVSPGCRLSPGSYVRSASCLRPPVSLAIVAAFACAILRSLRRGSAARHPSLLLPSSGHRALRDSPLGPQRESFFLMVVDDYSCYTTVFPLAKKFDVTSTLIRWLLTTADTHGCRVRCLHSDRGGEFRSGILAGFCHEQGIRQSWTLPESPQQNGVAERCWCNPTVCIRLVIRVRACVCAWNGLSVPPAPLNLTSALPPAPPVQPPPPSPTPPPSVAPKGQPPSPQSSSQPTADPAGAGFCGEDPGGASSRGAGVGAESVPVRGPGSGGAGVGPEPVAAGDSSLWGAGEPGTDPVTSGGAGSGGGAIGSLESGPGATTAPDTTPPPHPYLTRHQARWVEEQQQQPEQEQPQQQQQPPPPRVSGLRTLGVPSPSPPSPPSPPVSGPPLPPPDPSPSVFPPPLPPLSPPLSHTWSSFCSPHARHSSPVPFADLRTALFCSTPPRLSPSVLPSPLESALTASLSTPVTEYYRTYHPVLSRALASLVTDPCATLSSISALTTAVTEFSSTRCLDYATCLVAAPSTSLLAIGGESALGNGTLEDRQFEMEFLAAASPHLCAMLLAPEGDPDALDIPTPRTYAEAVSGPWASQWRAAMDSQMASYRSTGTYVDKVPSFGANVVDGMWIFRVKRPPGSPPVFKARNVARGFTQREGVDFFHTFAPTPKMTTLRPSSADPSLFVRRGSTPFFVLVYVDDLVFATAARVALVNVKLELQKRHSCTDLGELRHYLGLQITRDKDARTITLSQSHMVQQVLQRFELQHSTVQRTPLAVDHKLSGPFPDEPFEPSGPYAELVGCLMYLMTCTRPNLAFPLSILARFVAPGRHHPVHWTATVRMAKYLATTSGVGLVLGGRQDVVLTGHCDSSYADDAKTQRSS
ncbi:unnamed protein product [Closterium sp. NIES-53]